MEITNANAAALLPYITAQLRDCSYVAIDLEFTGIDRDGTEPGADTPAALADSLMRKPGDLYPNKLEALRSYSIIQLGFSLFTRQAPAAPSASSGANASAATSVPQPTVAELATHVKEFVTDATRDSYYVHFLQSAVNTYAATVAKSGSAGGASGWTAMLTLVASEAARVGGLMVTTGGGAAAAAPASSTEAAYATDSTVELLRRYHFLEALHRALVRKSREAEQLRRAVSETAATNTTHTPPQPCGSQRTPQSPASPPPAQEAYRVQTFTAYMFPCVQDENHSVSLNVDTAEFLVKNNIDLMKWVRDGLRFKPLKSAAAALAEDAAQRLRSMEQLSRPHTALPHFSERFKAKLDDLLPLSPAELQFVKFVLDLAEAPPSAATSHIVPFYIGATRPLIECARGELSESKLPESIYVKDKVYRDELNALAAIGLGKANRRYVRMANGGGGGGGSSGGGSSSSADGALTSSVAAQGYGTAVFEMLLYATEVLQKPLVLYNGYTDLMFLLLSLYGPQGMPPTLDGFKATVHRHFPAVYDTRVLACAGPLQELGNFTGKLSSVVEEMTRVSNISSQVAFQFDALAVGGEDPSLTAGAHNPGFDAMLTGKLFAYAACGVRQGGGDPEVYLNFLANYTTLLSINLTEKEDGVLQEEPTSVYFLAESVGLRVDAIREALRRSGLTALVMFRGSGYTIQPVGKACREPNYLKRAEEELTKQARSPVTLVRISI